MRMRNGWMRVERYIWRYMMGRCDQRRDITRYINMNCLGPTMHQDRIRTTTLLGSSRHIYDFYRPPRQDKKTTYSLLDEHLGFSCFLHLNLL